MGPDDLLAAGLGQLRLRLVLGMVRGGTYRQEEDAIISGQ